MTSTRAAQANLLGIDPSDLQSGSQGAGRFGAPASSFAEVLIVPEGVVAVKLERDESRSFYIFSLVDDEDEDVTVEDYVSGIVLCGIGDPAIEGRLEHIATFLSERYDLSFESLTFTNRQFQELKGEGLLVVSPPAQEEDHGANALVDPGARRAALAIASAGGLLMSDVPRQLAEDDQARAEEIVDGLREGGIVASDFVVVCRRSSAQVARVPSRAALEQASESGVRCACGRKLTEERVEEAVALTGLGRQLLNGSWWMSVVLIRHLHSLGIPYENMLVEQKSGGDEVDCFADISGELTLFELKDKEFSLGNAYSFGAKIGIHRPSHAVVVTTAHVGSDAKEHFKKSLIGEGDGLLRRRRRKIHYMEGLDALASELEELVDSIHEAHASGYLSELLPSTALNAGSLLKAVRRGRAPASA